MRIALRKPAKKAKLPIDDGTKPLRHHVPEKIVCPADVIAERDRIAALDHQSITAAFCKDPLPGRSALDQRHQP